jgi:hypothetical protein
LYVFYAYQRLHLAAFAVAFTVMMNYVGTFLGATITPRLVRSGGLGVVVASSSFAAGFTLFLIPLASISFSLLVLSAYNLLFGIFGTIWGVSTVSIRQMVVQPALLGRVNALMRAIAVSTLPLGSVVGGLASVSFGVVPTLYLMAGISSTTFLWFLSRDLLRLAQASSKDPATQTT